MNTIKQNDSFEWEVELLRFTGFPVPDVQIDQPNWWNDVMGEPSESRLIQSNKGLFQDKGPFEKGELLLKIEPFRIDWLYRAIQSPEEQSKKNMLGLFKETTLIYSNLIHKCLAFNDFPPLQRIAFGAIINQPAESHREGYNKLSKYLSSFIKLDSEGSSDFLYQINRPRESQTNIENLKINRLMKWSVQRTRLIGFVLNEELSKDIYKGHESFACRLELDINTVPDPNKRFMAEDCQKVFDELVQLALEISEKGDTK